MAKARPDVFDLSELTVKPTAPRPAPAPATAEETPPAPASVPAPTATFRTSLYFHRPVHDVLRKIAFEQRRTITDLINEGLDMVLVKNGYPTTGELKERAGVGKE